MSFSQLIVLMLVALGAALTIIVLIPRTRRVMLFEIVIWFATWIVAALSAWLALGAVESLAALRFLALLPIAGVPLVPLVIGAFGGALVLTIPLWLMDRFAANDAPDEET